jgi:hypothetical protein
MEKTGFLRSYCTPPAGASASGAGDGNALACLYQGDHGIEIIEDGTPMNENTGEGKMLVDELLDEHRLNGRHDLRRANGGSMQSAQVVTLKSGQQNASSVDAKSPMYSLSFVQARPFSVLLPSHGLLFPNPVKEGLPTIQPPTQDCSVCGALPKSLLARRRAFPLPN